MTGESLTLTRPQVARILQISVEVFYRTRKDLEAKGLPKPLFGRGKGERWSELEVTEWVKRGGKSPILTVTLPDLTDEQKAAGILDGRARQLAQGGRP